MLRYFFIIFFIPSIVFAEIENARDLMEAGKFQEAMEELMPAARSGNADAEELPPGVPQWLLLLWVGWGQAPGHSSSIWFCPLFCPLPHLPYILPSFLPLPLPSFFAEGKGKGKKWGQNIGQMWKRAKLKAKLEGKNIRGRGQNTGQKCEFIWNNSWAPKTPNIKTKELIWTDCTFPTFIWSLLSLFKFEKKNARQWNWVKKIENLQKSFWWSVKIKISKFPMDTV